MLCKTKFLSCYDLRHAEGKHYYEASRRKKEDLVVRKTDAEFREMLPDAVTIAVVLHLPGNARNASSGPAGMITGISIPWLPGWC